MYFRFKLYANLRQKNVIFAFFARKIFIFGLLFFYLYHKNKYKFKKTFST